MVYWLDTREAEHTQFYTMLKTHHGPYANVIRAWLREETAEFK